MAPWSTTTTPPRAGTAPGPGAPSPGAPARGATPPAPPDGPLPPHPHAVPGRHRPVDQRALPGACDTGDHRQHTQRDVDVDVAQVVARGAADLQGARRRPDGRLERGPVVEGAAGQRGAGRPAPGRAPDP